MHIPRSVTTRLVKHCLFGELVIGIALPTVLSACSSANGNFRDQFADQRETFALLYYKAALCVVSTSTWSNSLKTFMALIIASNKGKYFTDLSTTTVRDRSHTSVLDLPCFTECSLFGLTEKFKIANVFSMWFLFRLNNFQLQFSKIESNIFFSLTTITLKWQPGKQLGKAQLL